MDWNTKEGDNHPSLQGRYEEDHSHVGDALSNAFEAFQGEKHIGRVFPVEMTSLKQAFEKAVKKAGLEDLHFHDLRHTSATRLVQAGVDLYAVKNVMGHRSIKTTKRYAHHYPESLRPMIKVLDTLYEADEEFGHVLVTVGGQDSCITTGKASKIAPGSA